MRCTEYTHSTQLTVKPDKVMNADDLTLRGVV